VQYIAPYATVMAVSEEKVGIYGRRKKGTKNLVGKVKSDTGVNKRTILK